MQMISNHQKILEMNIHQMMTKTKMNLGTTALPAAVPSLPAAVPAFPAAVPALPPIFVSHPREMYKYHCSRHHISSKSPQQDLESFHHTSLCVCPKQTSNSLGLLGALFCPQSCMFWIGIWNLEEVSVSSLAPCGARSSQHSCFFLAASKVQCT